MSASDAPAADDQVLKPIINVTRERIERPLLAPDVELVGRVQDSAFKEEQWLICFEGSNYIQATPLLYHVLLFANGTRTVDEIAREVAAALSIEVTGEDVDWLVRNRLVPSGLLDLGLDDLGDGPRPAEIPVLGLRWRIPILPYEWTVPFVDALRYLYWPPLMIAVVLAAAAINVWLFIDASVIASAQALLFQPELILVLFVLDTISTLFHEFGHAAALRRAGARYGWIGFALYVIFPVFYTDVTHLYRLNRRERIRVDLGGMYFELVMMVVFFGGYLVSGHGIFLIAIVLTTLSFLQQFTPFLRFDGYYTVADVMGINEPLSIVKPFMRDRIPWPRGREKSLPEMRTGARIAFTAYLLAVVAFLTYPLFIGAFAGREFATAIFESGRYLWTQSYTYWSTGEFLWGVVATLQFFLWALIPLGLTLFALTLIRHFWMAGQALISAVRSRSRKGVDPSPSGDRMRTNKIISHLVIIVLVAFGSLALTGASAAGRFGNEDIERVWSRLDLPVEHGSVARTWFWGPKPISGLHEEMYIDAPGGKRLVIYFDKTRMEIYAGAETGSTWRVTNGLLATELLTGQVQLGNDTFVDFDPPEINVAGDLDDLDGPTYRSLGGHLNADALPEGTMITATIARDGSVGNDNAFGSHGVTAGHYVPETGHTIASVFWDYMTSHGMIYHHGEYLSGPLFDNHYYGVGYPLTEAYWTVVRVNGAEKPVLVQAFQRRVLTYTPDNPDGWKVEAGNVGLHYRDWRASLGDLSEYIENGTANETSDECNKENVNVSNNGSVKQSNSATINQSGGENSPVTCTQKNVTVQKD